MQTLYETETVKINYALQCINHDSVSVGANKLSVVHIQRMQAVCCDVDYGFHNHAWITIIWPCMVVKGLHGPTQC